MFGLNTNSKPVLVISELNILDIVYYFKNTPYELPILDKYMLYFVKTFSE